LAYLQYFDDKQFEIRHLKMKLYKSRMNDEALNRMTERDASALLSQIESSEEELLIFEIDSLKT
jgi:hypothetical protein